MVLTSCARRRTVLSSTTRDVIYFVCNYVLLRSLKVAYLTCLVILRTGLAWGPQLVEDRVAVSCRRSGSQQTRKDDRYRVETREEQDGVLVAFDLVDAYDLLRSVHSQKRARPEEPRARGLLDHELFSSKFWKYESQRSHRV